MILGYGSSDRCEQEDDGGPSKACLPPLHVWFDIKQVLEANAPWLSWSRFKHEPSKLGVENGSRVLLCSFGGQYNEIEFDVATSLGIPGLKVRHSASLLQKLLVIGKRS